MSWLVQLWGKGVAENREEAPTWLPTGIDMQNQISHKVQIKCTFIFRLEWGKEGHSQSWGRGHTQGHSDGELSMQTLAHTYLSHTKA